MGSGRRGGDRGRREGPGWPEMEGQAAERVTQCQVFGQGLPAEELEEALQELMSTVESKSYSITQSMLWSKKNYTQTATTEKNLAFIISGIYSDSA